MVGDTDKNHESDERTKQRKRQIRRRDRKIKTCFLCSDEEKRKEGLVILLSSLRRPVASVLLHIAWNGNSPAYLALLDPKTTRLNGDLFDDIWQETGACVWKRVQAGQFKSNGSLLGYVAQIAKRQTHDHSRKKRRIDDRIEEIQLEQFADNRNEQSDEQYQNVLRLIEEFYDTLSEENRAILSAGVALVRANCPKRGLRQKLVTNLDEIFRKKGWKVRSAEAIYRQYSRLRDQLRQFLKERGCDV